MSGEGDARTSFIGGGCYCHGLTVWGDEHFIYVSLWTPKYEPSDRIRPNRLLGIRQRMRHAYRALRYGEPYVDEMVLTAEQATEVSRNLMDRVEGMAR